MAHRLLLADDSITIQKVVELTLSEEDFDVTAVGDGEAALEAAKKSAPDIILADVFMPKMDGYQLCGKLKQDPALRGIPVILLAGTFEDYDDAMAARAGADDHLTKPFESAELISMVKRLIEKGKAPEVPVPQQPIQAEPAPAPEEALVAEEVVEAAPVASPADASDDLWSVVDMQSEKQPLSDATAILTEEDLWRRANLVSAPAQQTNVPEPAENKPMAAAPVEAEPEIAAIAKEDYSSVPLEDDEETAEPTAILNMDDLGRPSIEAEAEAETEPELEPEPIELAEVSPDADSHIYTFDNLQEASLATDFIPQTEPAVQHRPASAGSGVSIEAIREAVREEVAKAVSQALDAKIKQAVATLSNETVERIVWEVVPDLAEEILVKEIEKLKAGV